MGTNPDSLEHQTHLFFFRRSVDILVNQCAKAYPSHGSNADGTADDERWHVDIALTALIGRTLDDADKKEGDPDFNEQPLPHLQVLVYYCCC